MKILSNINNNHLGYYQSHKKPIINESKPVVQHKEFNTGSAEFWNSYKNLVLSSHKLSFKGETAEKIKSAIILNDTHTPLPKRPDGGYLVDLDTHTVLYYGEDAAKYLSNVTNHTEETQIIAQSGCEVSVNDLNGNIHTLNEPGGIIINANTMAKANVIKGNLVVVTTGKTPDWYGKHSADSVEHKEYFGKIAQLNKQHKDGYILSDVFSEYMDLYTQSGILETSNEPIYVIFNKDLTFSSLVEKLSALNVPPGEKIKITNLYLKKQEDKKSKTENPGEIPEDYMRLMQDDTKNLLQQKSIITDNGDGKFYWGDYYSIDALQSALNEENSMPDNEKEKIVEIWKKTTKSGYDVSGLKSSSDGITVYTHKNKRNLFTNTHTEWITNSTEWASKGSPLLGMSRVYNGDRDSAIRAFSEIRPQECIHRHENLDDLTQKQTEIYLLTQGNAAMYTDKGIQVLSPGDLYIIPTEVDHGIIAVDGEYEHLCLQTPSSFQYGFKFKSESQNFSDDLVNEAKSKLNIKY